VDLPRTPLEGAYVSSLEVCGSAVQHSHKPPSWWGGAGCVLPKNPTPTLGPSGLASLYLHSKISSDALAMCAHRTRNSNHILHGGDEIRREENVYTTDNECGRAISLRCG